MVSRSHRPSSFPDARADYQRNYGYRLECLGKFEDPAFSEQAIEAYCEEKLRPDLMCDRAYEVALRAVTATSLAQRAAVLVLSDANVREYFFEHFRGREATQFDVFINCLKAQLSHGLSEHQKLIDNILNPEIASSLFEQELKIFLADTRQRLIKCGEILGIVLSKSILTKDGPREAGTFWNSIFQMKHWGIEHPASVILGKASTEKLSVEGGTALNFLSDFIRLSLTTDHPYREPDQFEPLDDPKINGGSIAKNLCHEFNNMMREWRRGQRDTKGRGTLNT